MTFIRNKNSAFSLIEILQTVVLIGIIAGLSISFFRSVNTDTKLRDSTEIMLYQAIQEANRQMCSDTTPFCRLAVAGDNRVRGSIIDNNVCNNGNLQNGFCVIARPNDGNCPADTEEYTERDGTVNCYSMPLCNGGAQAVPIHEQICPNGIPQWNALIQRNDAFPNINQNLAGGAAPNNVVSEICYRLWDLINHRRQDANIEADLIATCATAVNNCFATNNTARPCSEQGIATGTNMILPNGVRLYNLSGLANNAAANPDGQHIYIKYDRNPLISTHDLDNTSSIFNAVWFGQPNNLFNAVAGTPSVLGGTRGQNRDPVIPSSIQMLLRKDGIIDNNNEPIYLNQQAQ